MITVGIPRALLYYKYGNLWINYLENLGCNVIVSPNTNEDIVINGLKLSNNDYCQPLKIYLGHINYLIDKCDYILIPTIKSIKKKEKMCYIFSCINNLVNNYFNINILTYNIDVNHNETEEYSFIKMGRKLGFGYIKCLSAYNKAKIKDNLIKIRKYNKQRSIIANSNRLKVLLAGHSYNLYDNEIIKDVISILENNNIDIIYSDSYDLKYMDKEVLEITKNNPFTYNKEIIASIVHYKNMVDGIILISSNNCENDSLSNYMIKRCINTKVLDLELNDNITNSLNDFIRHIKERKINNER